MDLHISGLYVYPIKSLGGIALPSARITATGFPYDRHWMLVDHHGRCLTQRETPRMALFDVIMHPEGVTVRYEGDEVDLPFHTTAQLTPRQVHLWKEPLDVLQEPEIYHRWFSDRLGLPATLVRMDPDHRRPVKEEPSSSTFFTEGHQYLLHGQAGLDELNQKLPSPIRMNRFRPNLVFSGGTPNLEDQWAEISIGPAQFSVTGLCFKCKLVNVDQEHGTAGPEPIRTLASYRFWDRNIWLGVYLNLLHGLGETIYVGDKVTVLRTKSVAENNPK